MSLINLTLIILLATIIEKVNGATIYSEVAEGMCQQYDQFSTTKTLTLRLERNQHPAVILPQFWLKWKSSCIGSSCTPFKIIVNAYSREIVKPQSQNKNRQEPKLGVIVEVRGEPDCQGHTIEGILSKVCDHDAGKARAVTTFLKNHATTTQAEVLKILESKQRSMGFIVEPMWITNKILVTGSDVSTVKQMLRGHKDVKTVRLEEMEELIRTTRKSKSPKKHSTRQNHPSFFWGQIELNISAVHSAGVNGSGVVVGNLDSGVDFTHPALFNNFRTEYGWFDPFHLSTTPNDVEDDGHGTHVMGIMVGEQGFGVAPGAAWIACKACIHGCLENAIIRCMQWMLCPTRSNGSEPDCSKKPRVVNCSWGGPEFRKGQRQPRYEGMLHCWRQAGIIPVFSAGNRGPVCSGLSYPGVSNKVISVGMLAEPSGSLSTHVHDNSSRGPPDPYWNGTIKPDFVAPGEEIYSTYPGGRSNWETGSSQAAPHVAGTIALMLQVNPTLDFDGVRNALIESTRPTPVVYPQSCGGIAETVYPNFQAGYGSINAFKAVFGRWP